MLSFYILQRWADDFPDKHVDFVLVKLLSAHFLSVFKVLDVDARTVKSIFKGALGGCKEYNIDVVCLRIDLLEDLLESLSFLFVIAIVVNI